MRRFLLYIKYLRATRTFASTVHMVCSKRPSYPTRHLLARLGQSNMRNGARAHEGHRPLSPTTPWRPFSRHSQGVLASGLGWGSLVKSRFESCPDRIRSFDQCHTPHHVLPRPQRVHRRERCQRSIAGSLRPSRRSIACSRTAASASAYSARIMLLFLSIRRRLLRFSSTPILLVFNPSDHVLRYRRSPKNVQLITPSTESACRDGC